MATQASSEVLGTEEEEPGICLINEQKNKMVFSHLREADIDEHSTLSLRCRGSKLLILIRQTMEKAPTALYVWP